VRPGRCRQAGGGSHRDTGGQRDAAREPQLSLALAMAGAQAGCPSIDPARSRAARPGQGDGQLGRGGNTTTSGRPRCPATMLEVPPRPRFIPVRGALRSRFPTAWRLRADLVIGPAQAMAETGAAAETEPAVGARRGDRRRGAGQRGRGHDESENDETPDGRRPGVRLRDRGGWSRTGSSVSS
jgi:hypothetical protein